MVKNHLSRLAAPKNWPIRRKTNKWIVKPISGPHSINESIPLCVFIREILEYAKTAKEIKTILNKKYILVDKVARTDYKFPIGLMDVVEIPELDEHYRMVFDKNGMFSVLSINKDEANLKLLKIIRKNLVNGGKVQITLHDGRNILVDKFDAHTGDSILFDIKNKSVKKLLVLEKDSLVYLHDGSFIGKTGNVKDLIKTQGLQKSKIVVEIDGEQHLTLASYALVVGKNKPEINLENKK